MTTKIILKINGVEWFYIDNGLYFSRNWYEQEVAGYGLTLKELIKLYYPNAKHWFLNKPFNSYRDLVDYLNLN